MKLNKIKLALGLAGAVALSNVMAAGDQDYTLEQVVTLLIEKRATTLRGLFDGH